MHGDDLSIFSNANHTTPSSIDISKIDRRIFEHALARTGVGSGRAWGSLPSLQWRNGVEQLLLQNSGHASTMAVVATIELAEWPAMQGRAVYLGGAPEEVLFDAGGGFV